jgi:hypothetical protein
MKVNPLLTLPALALLAACGSNDLSYRENQIVRTDLDNAVIASARPNARVTAIAPTLSNRNTSGFEITSDAYRIRITGSRNLNRPLNINITTGNRSYRFQGYSLESFQIGDKFQLSGTDLSIPEMRTTQIAIINNSASRVGATRWRCAFARREPNDRCE